MALDVEKTSPTSMRPFVSALIVCGPPTSSGWKLSNSSPYVSSSPGRQKGRSGHSGGPPKTIWLAIGSPPPFPSSPESPLSAPTPDPHAANTSVSAMRIAPWALLRKLRMGSSLVIGEAGPASPQVSKCTLEKLSNYRCSSGAYIAHETRRLWSGLPARPERPPEDLDTASTT